MKTTRTTVLPFFLTSIVALAVLFACEPRTTESTEQQFSDTTVTAPAHSDPWSSPTETITGTANGINIIFQHNKFQEYRLITGTDTITGPLNTERGFENDEDATLYIVYHTFPDSVLWHFVRMTDGRYRMLDANQKELPDTRFVKK